MADSPERLLIVVSNIDLPAVKQEVKDIRDTSLSYAKTKRHVDTDELLNVDYNSLTQKLNSQDASRITMLHYTGHSSNSGIVVEVDGENKILGLAALATLIQTHNRFRFVFLNSCYSQEIAESFIKIGVSYVIGTTGKIKDQDAQKVAAKFYEFLGATPKTIERAYQLTNEFFVQNPDKLNLKGEFRSLVTEKKSGTNVWQLFEATNLTEEQKNWTLVPEYKLVLSHSTYKDFKLKVLCLYEKKSAKCYSALESSFLGDSQNSWIINGVWEIFGDNPFDNNVFEKELNSAHAIIHLIEGNDYLVERFNSHSFENKVNAVLPVGAIDKDYFSKKDWFSKSVMFAPSTNYFGESVAIILTGFGKSLNDPAPAISLFKESISTFLKKQLSENYVDPQEIKKDLKLIEFFEETKFKEAYDIPNPFLNFIIIESTSDCALPHLVSKIREAAVILKKNNSLLLIPFDKINSELEFWSYLHGILHIEYIPDDVEEFSSVCINIIMARLKKEQNVCIVCRNVSSERRDIYKSIQARIQEVILQKKEQLSGLYTKFLFFVINEDSVSFDSITSNSITAPIGIFRYAQIIPMDKAGVVKWIRGVDTKYEKLKNTHIIPNYFGQQKPLRRKIFMQEICKELEVDPIKVIDSILTYE